MNILIKTSGVYLRNMSANLCFNLIDFDARPEKVSLNHQIEVSPYYRLRCKNTQKQYVINIFY